VIVSLDPVTAREVGEETSVTNHQKNVGIVLLVQNVTVQLAFACVA
jgi:hypothetical protein